MAYDEKLADRIRQKMGSLKAVEEKAMMGGLAFMYRDKMCVGIFKDQLMCRIDPAMQDELLENNGVTQMELGCRKMNGYLLISPEALTTQKAFSYWIELCIAFNKKAKSSKKKK